MNIFDKCVAETSLFYYLKEYKIKNNLEFLNCSEDVIKTAFLKVDDFFKKYDTTDKLFNYFTHISNYN